MMEQGFQKRIVGGVRRGNHGRVSRKKKTSVEIPRENLKKSLESRRNF